MQFHLAHGVGRLYESPLPLSLYLVGAAATVLVSFLLRALAKEDRAFPEPRLLLGPRAANGIVVALRILGVVGLVLTIISGIAINDEGLTFPALLFWVGLIVGGITVQSIVAGTWEAGNPWATLEGVYRIEEAEVEQSVPPAWLGPLLVYLLFWFELVSGAGFDSFWIVFTLVAYSIFFFTMRLRWRDRWNEVDPLAILFGFAGRIAPLRLSPDGLYYKGSIRELNEERLIPEALYAAVFVTLGATTLDNVRETVGWSRFRADTGLDAVPDVIFDSIALALFALPFLATFLGALWISRQWLKGRSVGELGPMFAWALIPIAIAYILAHNAPLLISNTPYLIQGLSDPFARGWNLFGTAELFRGFSASPGLVWFLEIAIIVGGHILGVLSAHRIAVRSAGSHGGAVKSQYALTALMASYTIATLWLLSQPLVEA